MSNKVKDIDIKNHIYYFFDDIINVKNFDPNNIKIYEKLFKNILIYCIGYGYFCEINKNRYLMVVPTNENKEIIKNMKNRGVKSEI